MNDLVLPWLRERCSPLVFIPLALIVHAAGSVGRADSDLSSWLVGVAASLLLILAFRAWDDLADVSLDIVRHPDRVLSKVADRRPLGIAAMLAGVAGAAMVCIADGPLRTVPVAGAACGLWLWYRRRAAWQAGPVLNAHVILLKYPAIAIAVGSGGNAAARGLSAASLYLALCLYELAHDRSVRQARGGAMTLTVEVGLLIGLAASTLTAGGIP